MLIYQFVIVFYYFQSMQAEALRVCVTGAAGQIGYALLYALANGDVFGKDQASFNIARPHTLSLITQHIHTAIDSVNAGYCSHAACVGRCSYGTSRLCTHSTQRHVSNVSIHTHVHKFTLLTITEVVSTADVEVAFKDVDVVIMVGAMPRKEGMERKELLKANAKIFESQGKALDKFAKKSVKVCRA